MDAPRAVPTLDVLFLCDPNLGPRGAEIVDASGLQATKCVWDRGAESAAEDREAIRRAIRSKRWDVCISLYSDLVLHAADLAQIEVALNIHPSLPSIRGVGYDTLPIIEGHTTFGATLHYMEVELDAGEIIQTRQDDLPPNAPRSWLRARSQELCLDLLSLALKHIRAAPDVASLTRSLAQEECQSSWGSLYVSRLALGEKMEALRQRDPGHPVFR